MEQDLPSRDKSPGKRTETISANQPTQQIEDGVRRLRIQIKSVGCFDPPFYGSHCTDTVGSINVNGMELSKNQPGLNFVVLDLQTGEMEQSVNFDTHGQAGADERMEDFLNGLSQWKIICIAVKDDAKTYLSNSALQSFTKIGANQIVSQHLDIRASYAFIGLSGPEIIRKRLPWIREENTRAGDGPSIISVVIDAGQPIVEGLQSMLHLLPPSKPLADTTTQVSKEKLQHQQQTLKHSQQKDIEQLQNTTLATQDSPPVSNNNDSISHNQTVTQPETTTTTTTTTTPQPTTTTTATPSTTTILPTTQPPISQQQQQQQMQVLTMPNKTMYSNPLLLANLIQTLRTQALSTNPTQADTDALLQKQQQDTSAEATKSFNNLQPLDIANLMNNPSNPVSSLIEAAKSYNQEITANKKSTQNGKPTANQALFLKGMLDNVNRIKAQLQMQLLSNNVESLPKQTATETKEASTHEDAEQRKVSADEDEDSEARSKGAPSTMEAAADASGSRNVGESRLASALSALGLPDAGATGISSLMAAGFVAAGGKKKKEASLKLGLASKLSKSIADLGGRGAASAAGIASLCDLLKDSRDMSTTRLADQIGQALQRVGGAGAAVGYAALAASLKAIGDKPKPGALIGGIVLALAEQGSAPGTAGLAALAAGLGGSGADALAGGLGGSLPNIIQATKTNNFMAGGEVGGVGGASVGGGVSAALTSGGETQYHSDNIDAEYTGQGPIGSASQSGGVGGFGYGGGYLDHGGECRSLGCKTRGTETSSERSQTKESPYASVRSTSPTKEAALYGGGELVNTDEESPDQKCSMKRSSSPRCNRLCNEKSAASNRLLDVSSSDKKASIRISGEEYSRNEDGFNLVVVDYPSGQVESSENFDTTQDAGSAKAMTNFIRSLGDKKIVIGATKGNAGQFMFNDVYKSLGDIGVKKLMNFGGLNSPIKYVFIASKGDVLTATKEDAGERMAELMQPLAVGSGGLVDMCSCLKTCAKTDKENAYADLGDGNNIAGTKRQTLSTKHHRVVVPRKTHNGKLHLGITSSKRNHDALKIDSSESVKGKSLSSIHENTETDNTEKSGVISHDVDKEHEIKELVGSIISSGTEEGDKKKHVPTPQAISSLNNGWKAVGKAIETEDEKEQAIDEVLAKKNVSEETTNKPVSEDIYSSIGNSLRQ
uniref:ILEI/PANDER domain-containing protein n=3 Tax=Clytia hemisphaerica TaxID=252671 RepID=A0A7M5XPK4_9CNID